MTKILMFALILLSMVGYSQVIIRGEIQNYDDQSEIFYSHSWQGIHPKIGQSIKPSTNGNFKIAIKNGGIGTIKLGYKRLWFTLFYNDNSKINIEFDENDPDSFSVFGDFEVVNNYYYNNPSFKNSPFISVDGNKHSQFISNLQSPQRVVDAIDSMVQREIDIIKTRKLVDIEGLESSQNQIIKKYLVNEIKAYYGIVFLNAMFLKKMEQFRAINKDSTKTNDIYNSQWQRLIELFTHNIRQEIKPIPNSPYYNELVRMHSYIFQSYKEYDFQQPMFIDEDLYDKLVGFDSLLFNDPKSVLAYKLNYLNQFLGSELYYSPALMDITNQLKSEYPELPYWQLLEPKIKKLNASIIASGKKYKDAEILKTNYTSFNGLLNHFQGQYLYIDIWATWCLPCIKDFQNKDETASIIEPEVERLYISIDQPRFEDRWKQSIKYNELKGYHVRANNELIEDMWDEIGGYKGAIPRYILIDKSGKIFHSNAARPGNSKELIKQIEEMLVAGKIDE